MYTTDVGKTRRGDGGKGRDGGGKWGGGRGGEFNLAQRNFSSLTNFPLLVLFREPRWKVKSHSVSCFYYIYN
jgi:hypothetical protein